jgi:hypothetical protein
MIENGFYKIKQEYIALINNVIGGVYRDAKARPVFCCIEDKYIKNIFWAIPTSDLSHRTAEQLIKNQSYCKLDPNKDIRGCYYHMGRTNKPAVYRISTCLPITDKYIESPYTTRGVQLFLMSKTDIVSIRTKLARILLDEMKHPNKYEQHITDIQDYLVKELN